VTADVILPFPAPVERLVAATNIRSTLIASSLRAVREGGRYDAYIARLPAAWKDLPLQAIAGLWLPIEAGVAHYRACDELGLSAEEQVANGRETGERIHGTFLGTMVRAAKSAGATPWIALGHTNKLYERLFAGGGCCVTKTGPKDARLEMAGNPVTSIAYFRNALRGLYQVGMELFCSKAYVTDAGHTSSSCTMRISWA
jgi:hypothetical protein